MANKKQAYFFSHDANSRNDLKVIKLRRNMGLEGYGIFWCIIEILRDTSDYRLPLTAMEDIAFEIKVDLHMVESVVKDFNLFKIEDDIFYSERLCESMEEYQARTITLSEAGKRGMQKRWNNNNSGPAKEMHL